MIIFVGAALAVIVLLVGVAGYYHILLYQKRAASEAARIELEAHLERKRQENTRSIHVLAQAVLEGQVSLTEASIRINALAQSLKLEEPVMESLQVFRQLSEATAHIPILDRWKALSKKQKRDFDRERNKIEADYHDFVVAAAHKIVGERILG